MAPKTTPLVTFTTWTHRGFSRLRRLWALWKVVAQKLGNVQAKLLLLVFYYLILAPFAAGVQLVSDPLRLKRHELSQWLPKARNTSALWDSARRQF